MKKLIVLLSLFISTTIFADTCYKDEYTLKVNFGVAGFFQKIKVYKNNKKILSEKFEMRYGEAYRTLAEQAAVELMPISNRSDFSVYESESATLVFSVVQSSEGRKAGERDTWVLEARGVDGVILFDMQEDCEKSEPLFTTN